MNAYRRVCVCVCAEPCFPHAKTHARTHARTTDVWHRVEGGRGVGEEAKSGAQSVKSLHNPSFLPEGVGVGGSWYSYQEVNDIPHLMVRDPVSCKAPAHMQRKEGLKLY